VAEVTRQLARLFELVHRNGLMPVVVVDDSDRFLQVVASEKGSAPDLFAPFVKRVLPWLGEFDCAKVVAVHPNYRERSDWSGARREGLSGDEIEVPMLDRSAQIAAILTRRLEAFGVAAALADVVDEDSVARLFGLYTARTDPTIRSCLTVASFAVALACDQGAESVSPLHVESAQADLG
jgi:hypothetical protein